MTMGLRSALASRRFRPGFFALVGPDDLLAFLLRPWFRGASDSDGREN
jgi:hypothetical protein